MATTRQAAIGVAASFAPRAAAHAGVPGAEAHPGLGGPTPSPVAPVLAVPPAPGSAPVSLALSFPDRSLDRTTAHHSRTRTPCF